MEKLIIYGMYLNQNKSLITLATDRGYRVLDTFKMRLLSDVYEILDLIGPLQIAETYYESKIVFFVGTEENINYPPSQIAIWDDYKRKKIGLIFLNTIVLDLKLTKKNIFAVVKNKILIFDVISLCYLITITNIPLNTKLISISSKINPTIIVYIDKQFSNNKIKIIKLYSNNENRMIGRVNKFILSNFEESQYIEMSKTREFIAEVSLNGCKINLYSLLDFQLKRCFWRGNSIANVLCVDFSKADQFMAIISNTLTTHIYNLEDIDKNFIKFNSSSSEEGIIKKSNSNAPGLIKKIKDFFNYSNSSFAKYKFNNENNDIDNSFSKGSFVRIMDFDYNILMFFNKSNEIVKYILKKTIIDNRGICEKLKYDTRKFGTCWNFMKINWTENDLLVNNF